MNVIGVFPNAGSVVRLVGALLIEENDRWAAMSKAYYSTDVAELEGRLEELAGIARERARLMLVGWPTEEAVSNLHNNLDLTVETLHSVGLFTGIRWLAGSIAAGEING